MISGKRCFFQLNVKLGFLLLHSVSYHYLTKSRHLPPDQMVSPLCYSTHEFWSCLLFCIGASLCTLRVEFLHIAERDREKLFPYDLLWQNTDWTTTRCQIVLNVTKIRRKKERTHVFWWVILAVVVVGQDSHLQYSLHKAVKDMSDIQDLFYTKENLCFAFTHWWQHKQQRECKVMHRFPRGPIDASGGGVTLK